MIMKELKQWRLILDTFRALLAPFFTLLFVIFTVYYLWSQIGVVMFGGLIFNGEMKIIAN